VQALLPVLGWRGLFWAIAGLVLGSMVLIAWLVPRDPPWQPHAPAGVAGYAAIVRHPLFVRTAPLGFFVYGGLVAVQALWAGPWLTGVCHWSAEQAAQGLFGINLSMLLAFLAWGLVMPRLAQRRIDPMQIMAWGLPLSLLLLLVNVALGAAAGALHWAAWCVACTFVSVSQPAVGAAFPAAQAGRALSAFNLVIFCGIFCIQWGLGLGIDALRALGLREDAAFRVAFLAFGLCCALSYAWFLRRAPQRTHNRR
jgi:predicted MFS family arabinose efflux permease